MKIRLLILLAFSVVYGESQAFCGFYVAKAGAELFNNQSQVIFVRDGNRSVITMNNDFKGNVKEFAMVVPVPTVLKRNQIRVADAGLFGKLDAYSGPRLVEYYDPNPCQIVYNRPTSDALRAVPELYVVEDDAEMVEEEYHVVIEATYAVGEYDILILSATESNGLKRWLTDNGYSIPAKAEKVLEPYIKSNLKFFVVKVNAEAHQLQGYQSLRPLQIDFESDKFMLPIRLGMANSAGEQDMIVYALTRNGRVETANYRTLEIPSNKKIPTFVQEKFGQFYQDLFQKSHEKMGKNSVFVEYAWTVTPTWSGVKCDPCVGNPPILVDLTQSGVWWLNEPNKDVFFTRLHVRYADEKFPQDLELMVTPNKTHFQGRYILTHPATGDLSCAAGQTYQTELNNRRIDELGNLASLTGWNVAKYSKYVTEGSGWIDERKNEIPVVVPTSEPPSNGPNNLIWIPLLTLGFAFILLGQFYLNIRRLAARNHTGVAG
ncbi:MAG: DUF2330 domain-containing protein [Flavobacteriales bacterium]|nr:DUF2330 domain-containing protein [Bacteroidota bacterium]MCB9240814.1 DUF2330 domain-containing protein [Flavobacteriales bacterium]